MGSEPGGPATTRESDELQSVVALALRVSNLSSAMLAVRTEQLSAVVSEALGDIGELTGADRAYVLKLDDTRSVIELFEEWWADGVERRVTDITDLSTDARRFWARAMSGGAVVQFPWIDDTEADDAPTRGALEALRADGVRSIVFLPLRQRDETIGFAGFEHRRTTHDWRPEAVALLRTVGELVVGASERCRAEDLLKRSNQDLERFAAIVAHDLKSPLQVIMGFVELLSRQLKEGGDVDLAIDATVRGVQRMDALIEDLLAYARAGLGADLQPVDLSEIVQDVTADASKRIDAEGATVHVGPLPSVMGDVSQLRQLAQNLLSNALKFRSEEAPTVAIDAVREDDRWVLRVTDNGVGVGPEDRERIFAMFARAHAGAFPGSGIGLAVCERVATNHRGRIWVEDNHTGSGSRFCVTLLPV